MSEQFFVRELPNGMTLLGQRMEQVSSAALTVLVPAGASRDPDDMAGAASVAVEWTFRGAGVRDTRALNDALDNLGAQHDEHVGSEHLSYASAQLGRNLYPILELYADILRRPRWERATFDPSRDLTLQDLAALEDEPARKCSLLLREKYYPFPLGRSAYGREETLAAMTADTLRAHAQRQLSPRNVILAVAGNIDWDAFVARAETVFGDWEGPAPAPVPTAEPAGGVTFLHKDSAQVHIALAHPTVPVCDPQYYIARVAEAVLADGMSSRLFHEVREVRGLVYTVGTQYHSLKERAGLFTYAGTRPELAQQTFDVTLGEIRRLAEGITADELQRAKTQIRSSLVMHGESTSARAGALASDWYHLRRLRPLREVSAGLEAVTVDDVARHLREHPAREFTVLIIGPEELDTSAYREA